MGPHASSGGNGLSWPRRMVSLASSTTGVSSLERIEAILANPALYRLAALIPRPARQYGGRQRDYPDFMLIFYEAAVSVYGSARRVEAELAHPTVWRFIRRRVKRRFPQRADLHLPRRPMRRHHYLYGRNRYLTAPEVLDGIATLYRELATEQAVEMRLLDPDGPGSFTHPHLSRMLYADGKVITPLFKAKVGETRVNQVTGEIKPLRCEPDADLHFQGDGEAAYGTKFVVTAARGAERHSRVILDVEWVERRGGEAKTAMGCFRRLAPLVPGAQGIIYDTALRGAHHQELLRELGLIPVNKVTAVTKGARKPRRSQGRRVEKSVHVEDKEVLGGGDEKVRVSLFARAGAIGLVELSDRGEPLFTPLPRVRTHRIEDKTGRFRWYNDYRLPTSLGAGTMTVRLHGNDEDRTRGFNRTENVRVIAPTEDSFKRLYARRNDLESINRGIDDSMWLTRAHSLGHSRQHLNLIGFALMVNSLALRRHRLKRDPCVPMAA